MELIKKAISKTKSLLNQDIIKVFSLNSISTLVRMLTGMISVKIVASIIGPVGVALLGQLNNFTSILLGIANGGINGGITKYVAEYKDSNSNIKRILSNALQVTIICTVIVSILLIILHNQLSYWIMLSYEYGYVFLIFGFTIFLYTLNSFLISVLNGFKKFKKYIYVNIIGTIIGLVFSVTLVLALGLSGALISAVTYQSIVVIATLFILRKEKWLNLSYYKDRLDKKTLKQFLGYSMMTIVSLSLVPTSQMFLRGYVIKEISPVAAGWWEGMNRISGMYLNVITTSFSIYYLPRLSEIKSKKELRREIVKSYKVIIPILITVFSIIYLIRKFIISLLFTPDFYPMENIFIWQMAGDLFKISSWLIAYLMIAKAMTKYYIFTEIIFSFSFVILGFILIKYNNILGLVQAYLINYIVYFIVMLILFRNTIFKKKHLCNKLNSVKK